jgi:pyruvate dehydrogenase E1 component alpha subunit
VESWKAKDPIARMKTFLVKQQLADDAFFGEVDESAKELALHLRERVLAMPDPEPVTMFDNVFPTGSPEVDAERAWFEQYQASFEGSAH